MCGGVLEMIRCSRVGHVYRKKSPYKYPGEGATHTQIYNKRRLVNVWLDEYVPFYYALNPGT